MTDLLFTDNDKEYIEENYDHAWKVLIVDDEPSMHQVTKMVLSNTKVDDRPLSFYSAHSGKEAKELFLKEQDFALAFIDVVMDSDEDGLNLIDWIRNDFGDHKIRLILRTGQAGKAPEESVIRQYDINDYKEKTELTSQKLKSCVYASIRSYRDIQTIDKSREGFKQVIQSSSQLLKLKTCKNFGSAILNELLVLLNVECSALCISRLTSDIYNNPTERILAATGKYSQLEDSLESINLSTDIKTIIQKTFDSKSALTNESYLSAYYETDENTATVMYVEFQKSLDSSQTHLLDIFCNNIALTFEALYAKEEIESTQLELMYILGEAIELRSKETGAHVKRVSLICGLLATKLCLPERLIQAITQAAPLHDIGKVAIPESILHKPGKLDDDEWQIMKTHAELGAQILKSSKRTVAISGEKLAHYHHENWDGSGYPEGLKGENIPVEARIMAIADVFDALGAKRCYKEPWSDDKIKAFITSQAGLKFDPKMAEIFINDYAEFASIRELYPD